MSPLWKSPAPANDSPAAVMDLPSEGGPLSPEEAEEVARRTMEIIEKRGWCPWKCHALGGIIIIIYGTTTPADMPARYPAYSLYELALEDDNISVETMKILNMSKTRAGAVLEKVTIRGACKNG